MDYILAYVEPYSADTEGIKIFVGDESAMVDMLNQYLDPPKVFTTLGQAVYYINRDLVLEGDEMLTLSDANGRIVVSAY